MYDLQRRAKKYAINKYGNLINVDEPIYDTYNERWIINVKSNYPRIIVDDKNNDRIVNAITLNKLCQLVYSKDGKIIKSPSKRECITSLRSSLNLWKENLERIITKASANNLSNVSTVRYLLRPIEAIIYYIYHNNRISEIEIENLTRTTAYMGWIELLEGLKIIEEEDGEYIFGEYGIGIRETYRNDIREILGGVISYTLSERYSYLREIMNVQQMGTVIHTNSCYYKSCIEADKIIKRKPKSIYHDYVKYYGKKSYIEIFYTLNELIEGKVIEYDNEYISANEEIFDRINEYSIDYSVTPPI